jgi:hypothetical protein
MPARKAAKTGDAEPAFSSETHATRYARAGCALIASGDASSPNSVADAARRFTALTSDSLDHLVGRQQQGGRDCQAERLGGLQVE